MKVQCVKDVTVNDIKFTELTTYNAQLCVNNTAIKVRYEDETISKGVLFVLNNSMVESFDSKPPFEKYFVIVEN